MADYAFDKSKRLLKASDFKPVFDNAVFKVSSKELLFLTKPNRLDHPRLGLVIAKKNVRLAVQRNRVKRIIRESFRLNQANIPALDIVVLARHSIDALDNASLHKHLAKLWQQLQRKAKHQPQ
ncbi:ribonuclease P protein component [Dasania marina]|uniref:ribonuclease P protein component n=1 Tax=Dasania marina TaxID=471499 RepID=UPI00037B0BAB|nr:ribonuclease P protein component [Dasania marina]|tara:strand:- start:21252 stop:21620 length:369 start_codon:yes stop_codon:yes gene_type:complete